MTALETAKSQYEEVSDRVVREFARFRRDKASDMKKIILDYVNVQVSLGACIDCCCVAAGVALEPCRWR